MRGSKVKKLRRAVATANALIHADKGVQPLRFKAHKAIYKSLDSKLRATFAQKVVLDATRTSRLNAAWPERKKSLVKRIFQRQKAKAKPIIRKANKRLAKPLKNIVTGKPPLKNSFTNALRILEWLDGGAKAKEHGGKYATVGGRKVLARDLRVVRELRKKRAANRISQIMKKFGKTKAEAKQYLEENGWKR